MPYLLSFNSVNPLHNTRVKLDGICDIIEDMLKRMSCLLVKQNPNGLAWLHTTAYDGDELGPDEVLDFFGFMGHQFSAGEGGDASSGCRGLHVHRPVGVDVLHVIKLLESLSGSTDITFS